VLLVALNAVFAGIFLTFAYRAALRARAFFITGWAAVGAGTEQPDYRENIELRRFISEGGRFLIGALMWGAASIGAAGLGVFFALELLRLYIG